MKYFHQYKVVDKIIAKTIQRYCNFNSIISPTSQLLQAIFYFFGKKLL